jgi:hypothetical protein
MSWSDKHEPASNASPVRLFGRDPLLWTAFLTAAVTTAAVLGWGLTPGIAGAINGLIVVAVALYTTRPVAPGLFTGVFTAGVALLAEYGIELHPDAIVALNATVLAALALATRIQVNPQATAVSRP